MGEKSSKNNKVKQYEEVGQCRTEAGGADQTIHGFTKVSDTQSYIVLIAQGSKMSQRVDGLRVIRS